MIELIHPPCERLSGGNIYNRSLLAAAAARGLPIAGRMVETREAAALWRGEAAGLRIWDSYFLNVLPAEERSRGGRHALLLHYLPSQDPTRSEAGRRRLAAREKRLLAAASFVLATSRELAAAIRHDHPRLPLAVCEPGVSRAFLAPPPEPLERARRTVVLVTVANLLPAKGYVELLGMLGGLRNAAWRWDVIGEAGIDPDYTRRFDDLATALGLGARVRRHGALGQDDVARLLDAADLFAFASRFEAYGMALAEAAARRLPAVTTDVGAASRIYEHGVTGLLAPPSDSARFARHLARLVGDRAVREQFRARLAAFRPRTWDDTLDEFVGAIAPFHGTAAA